VLAPEQIDETLFSKVKSARDKKQQQKDPVPPSDAVDVKNQSNTHSKNLTERYNLKVTDHMPDNAQRVGNEYRGAHPIHGSTTGENVSLNIQDNVFSCFRCSRGGDAAIWDAINRGIIRCDEDYTLDKFKEHAKQLEKEFPDIVAKEREGYFEGKKQQKEIIQSAVYETEVLKERDDTPLSSHVLGTTDTGNADRFLKKYRDKFVFSPAENNTWYYWDNTVWREDKSSCVKKAAIEVIKGIYAEAKDYPEEADRKKVAAWAMKSEGEGKRRDMITTASYALSIPPDRWNNQPNLINCTNGTLEIDTLKFRDFRQDDYLTLEGAVEYNPDAACPEWTEHLSLVFGGDVELISAFQLLAGYSLLSGNPAQIFIILYGSGENGKSVTLNVLRMVLGDYASHIAAKTLMQQINPEKARSDLVRLRYKRLVTSAESKKGEKLDVGLIKELSGGEPLVARDLYKSEIQFRPEFTIWFATNHTPIINDASHSIWRRIWLIPFNQQIPADKKKLDYEKKLVESEGAGIFAWMVEGLKRYYESGLIKPESIAAATQEYQEDENPIKEFLDDVCIIDENGHVLLSEIYGEYTYWCNLPNINIKYPMGKRAFGNALEDCKFKRKAFHNGRGFTGLRLNSGVSLKTNDTR
jgi:P4 family phage/plasmid primase-like protien